MRDNVCKVYKLCSFLMNMNIIRFNVFFDFWDNYGVRIMLYLYYSF